MCGSGWFLWVLLRLFEYNNSFKGPIGGGCMVNEAHIELLKKGYVVDSHSSISVYRGDTTLGPVMADLELRVKNAEIVAFAVLPKNDADGCSRDTETDSTSLRDYTLYIKKQLV